MGKRVGNILGAFSDGAILFPLIATLSMGSGYSSSTLFVSTGLIYFFSGLYFRIPMPVQPLKAIAIAAVVSGASYQEVRMAGALVGVSCVLLALLPTDRLANRIPPYFVHAIQLSLGLMLLRRAVEILIPLFPHFFTFENLVLSCIVTLCWALSRFSGLSPLGFLAAAGAIIGITHTKEAIALPLHAVGSFRWEIVLALTLPQILLTSANSVIATRDVATRYFGKKADRVTIGRLLTSIGVGNILMALFGGLPFCHGSGGMTAHVRGGSNHWSSNFVIGFFSLFLAFLELFLGNMALNYPRLLLSLLLGLVGYYHIGLALPSWRVSNNRPTLLAVGVTTFVTQNLIYGLIVGTTFLAFFRLYYHRKAIA